MIASVVSWEDPRASLLALLVFAHLSAGGAPRSASLAERGLTLASVYGACALVAFPSWRGVGLVVALSTTRAALERIEARQAKSGLARIAIGQALQLFVLIGAAHVWPTPSGSHPTLGRVAAVVAVVLFNARGGSAIVGATLARLEPPLPPDEGPRGAGATIGVLERWMVLALVWANQWAGVGLVLTAKSVARFKRMDEQAFAEVYLIGTMASVLVAMVTGAMLRQIVGPVAL